MLIFLCGRGDSNPHALRHQILSLAWLPVTTRPRNQNAKIVFEKTQRQIQTEKTQ